MVGWLLPCTPCLLQAAAWQEDRFTGHLEHWNMPLQEVSSRQYARVFFFSDLLMILPQVHLRKPCYDFYFL